MPVDCELFFTGSPPLFRHTFSPIADFRFCNDMCSRLSRKMPVPIRPILIVRHPEAADAELGLAETAEQQPPVSSPTGGNSRSKKRVVFADDKGLALAHVKIMTEPSDCPPMWQDEFLEQVTRGASAAPLPPQPDKWEPLFPQPASDYVEFRKKLDSDCVSLENVIVKDCEETVLGTVKVKNLAFDKEVLVRMTRDAWLTHEDIVGAYVPTGIEGTAVYDLYDTFSFSMKLPSPSRTSQCIEFCLCFRCQGREYWDSNGGANYRLVSTPSTPKTPPPSPQQENPFSSSNNNKLLEGSGLFMLQQVNHAYEARLDNWSDFASWQHLVNDAPYW